MQSDTFYMGDGGKLFIKGPYGQTPGLAEKGDREFVGGGYKLKPVTRQTDGGSLEVVTEIVNAASGSTFFDDRAGFFGFSQDAFRSAPTARREFLDEGYRLWKYDPLGGVIVNLTTFFTMGRGLTINYNDPTVNQVLAKFWKKNKMPCRVKQLCDEGTAFGDNFIGLRVHRQLMMNGRKVLWRPGDVEVVIYDPKIVDGIEHAADNVQNVFSYRLSYTGEGGEEINRGVVDISKFDPDIHDECILHVKFNAATNDAYGLSDLVRIKEWLDNYQDFLRDSVIINKLYRSPCYDITIKDGDETDIANAVSRYGGWKIGANAVHNDKEEWAVLEFTGANMSSEDSRRALLLIVCAGVGMPEYMLGDGSNGNMASTRSQQLPAIKKFEDRQHTYQQSFVILFDFVLDMKMLFAQGTSRPIPEVDFEGDRTWRGEINFPEIAREEDSVVASSTASLVEAGLMARSTAAIKNGMDYEEQLRRMQADAILTAQLIKETQAMLSSLGVDPNEAAEIINKAFISVMTPPDEKPDPAEGGGPPPARKESKQAA
jgi:hypothetical protein